MSFRKHPLSNFQLDLITLQQSFGSLDERNQPDHDETGVVLANTLHTVNITTVIIVKLIQFICVQVSLQILLVALAPCGTEYSQQL